MPGTKVFKPKPVDTTRKIQERPKAAKESQSGLRVPAVRKSRASSCPRNPQPERCQRPAGGAQGSPSKPGSERRTRSTSTAPKPPQNCSKANRDCRRANHAAVEPKYQREQRAVRAEAKYATSHSNKAFTVIPPNPKKRREIQKKAEAELAALEELRLSRAMAYVSINPSSVGGCMSLEEVRSKQQQEMMLAKKKQKPV
uniref:Epithelial-stromal interaction protein 1 n=1 Tax=Oreochromis aureus TaxID=47969 RepID=A0AAZ1XGC3_OREAU